MKFTLLALAPAIVMASTSAVAEDRSQETPAKLNGTFSALIQEDCVFSASGFGPAPLVQALGPVTRGTGTIQGVATLKKDGTGEIVSRSAFIGTNTTLTPALGSTLTCPLSYTLDADGNFAAQYACTGTTTLGTGSQIALEVFQNGMKVSGHARNKRIVQAASTELAIETVGSTAAPAVPRMCHRTFQLLKIAKAGENE